MRWLDKQESCDRTSDATASTEIAQGGIKAYWKRKNLRSVDGLPGLLTAPDSKVTPVSNFDKEGPRPKLRRPSSKEGSALSICATLGTGFVLGVLANTVFHRILSNVRNVGALTT